MTRALVIFVDGIGMGRPGAQNPFDGSPIDVLRPLAGGAPPGQLVYQEIDASLGHPGLPQSATGQATIFTGEDAMAVAGGHVSGFPTRALASLLADKSVLARARAAGLRAGLLNAYPAEHAARLARIARGEEKAESRLRRPHATTLAALAGGGALRTFDDARDGRAATFDLTGEVPRAFGLDAPPCTVAEAARAVARGASELDVAVFEMFLTDKAGHAQDVAFARAEILRVERFLQALFSEVDAGEQLVLVTSDHGNLEDLSTRSHTRAPVPLVAYGRGKEAALGARSLLDVAPLLMMAASVDRRVTSW
jgi:hypothetical protein